MVSSFSGGVLSIHTDSLRLVVYMYSRATGTRENKNVYFGRIATEASIGCMHPYYIIINLIGLLFLECVELLNRN